MAQRNTYKVKLTLPSRQVFIIDENLLSTLGLKLNQFHAAIMRLEMTGHEGASHISIETSDHWSGTKRGGATISSSTPSCILIGDLYTCLDRKDYFKLVEHVKPAMEVDSVEKTVKITLL